MLSSIQSYFPSVSDDQLLAFDQLFPLYKEWNQKINVISRKDIDYLYEHHVLHSLAIRKVVEFLPGAAILDLGTGGGFPGIPLAILHPQTQFTLIDGTRKKIKVVDEVVRALDLKNVRALHIRSEEMKERFDFVVCRAVASLDKLLAWSRPLLKHQHIHPIPNGLLSLKGGNVRQERKAIPRHEYVEYYPIQTFFPQPYFEEKYVVYVQG